MGCDIHCYVEIKSNSDDNYGWEVIEDEIFTPTKFDCEYYKKDKTNRPFYWRNYTMFAILADVRNGGNVRPISKPKGLPNDISRGVWTKYYDWILDAHSQSYLTLRELVEYNYNDEFVMNNQLFFTHIEELKTLGGLDDVRIVFWFDN